MFRLKQSHLLYKSYTDLKQDIQETTDPRAKALFATIYASYARVGEVVRGRCNPNPPITREAIELTPENLLISLKTEKTWQQRTVPISRTKEEWLVQIVWNWAKSHSPLFPYSTSWAQNQFKKRFGTYNIHLLRHWATTHALQGHRTKKKLGAQYIARMGGWTKLDAFYRTYSHFVVEDFIDDV